MSIHCSYQVTRYFHSFTKADNMHWSCIFFLLLFDVVVQYTFGCNPPTGPTCTCTCTDMAGNPRHAYEIWRTGELDCKKCRCDCDQTKNSQHCTCTRVNIKHPFNVHNACAVFL